MKGETGISSDMARNVRLYPWYKFVQNLVFWQSVWFLFFQTELSAAEAILLYAVYDVATTAFEVPSGYMSDRIGRRKTLIAATCAGALGAGLIVLGDSFFYFALAQICLGASAAFASGTDSALLYESLAASEQGDQTEREETRALQASFWGLGVSAVSGGILATYAYEWAFAAGALAFVVGIFLARRFVEPPHDEIEVAGLAAQWRQFKLTLAKPVLVWLFILSVLMYGFSHTPFVFGQPFIAQAMDSVIWPVEAPVVSGLVSATMMLVSVLASLVALDIRRRIGLGPILLLAFGIQIGIIATLAATNSALAIMVLFLRMVPNSLAKPFILARIQPLLSDQGRATYLSIQSFFGRLLFAASLLLVSAEIQQGTVMAYADIQMTLAAYAAVGLVFFLLLFGLLRWARLETH